MAAAVDGRHQQQGAGQGDDGDDEGRAELVLHLLLHLLVEVGDIDDAQLWREGRGQDPRWGGHPVPDSFGAIPTPCLGSCLPSRARSSSPSAPRRRLRVVKGLGEGRSCSEHGDGEGMGCATTSSLREEPHGGTLRVPLKPAKKTQIAPGDLIKGAMGERLDPKPKQGVTPPRWDPKWVTSCCGREAAPFPPLGVVLGMGAVPGGSKPTWGVLVACPHCPLCKHPWAELDLPQGLRHGQEDPLHSLLGKDWSWALGFEDVGGVFLLETGPRFDLPWTRRRMWWAQGFTDDQNSSVVPLPRP